MSFQITTTDLHTHSYQDDDYYDVTDAGLVTVSEANHRRTLYSPSAWLSITDSAPVPARRTAGLMEQ